jgi:hypothetical protein
MARSCFDSEASYYSSVSIFDNSVRFFISDFALLFLMDDVNINGTEFHCKMYERTASRASELTDSKT